MQPIRARTGGALVRAGHTEGMTDLCRLAGLRPVGVGIEVMRRDGEMARRPELEAFAEKHGLRMCTVADVIRHRTQRETLVKRIETVDMPTRWGNFVLHAYDSAIDQSPHLALVRGDDIGRRHPDGTPVAVHDPALVRVHSECLTGDILGSLRCDCGPQLHTALEAVAAAGKGAVVYVRQEGRGIGLVNKLRAYKLQYEQGMDTVEANLHLGFEADRRDYGIGNQILRDLGLRQLRIMTNNPRKIYGLEGFGLEIAERVSIEIPAHCHNRNYLRTKKDKLGHLLDNL